MEGASGLADSSETPIRQWIDQWEPPVHNGDVWECNWDPKGDSSRYEEFENVMRWDDSGARDAFEIAKKIQEENLKGLPSSLLLPSPDLYIQVIDWDSCEDLKLPDSADAFSQHGQRMGQRKRGRNGGAFRRQFDRQDSTSAADSKQNGKAFIDPVCFNEVTPQDHTLYHDSSNMPVLNVPLDASQRESVRCQPELPVQDHLTSNWTARWSSQRHQRQNFASSNWQDHGRNNWDKGRNLQTHQSRDRWQQANVSFEPVRGWGRGGFPHHSSRGLLNNPHQSAVDAHMLVSNPGNEWMCRGEANGGRGKEQSHGPTQLSDGTHRWRQQQRQPYRTWQ